MIRRNTLISTMSFETFSFSEPVSNKVEPTNSSASGLIQPDRELNTASIPAGKASWARLKRNPRIIASVIGLKKNFFAMVNTPAGFHSVLKYFSPEEKDRMRVGIIKILAYTTPALPHKPSIKGRPISEPLEINIEYCAIRRFSNDMDLGSRRDSARTSTTTMIPARTNRKLFCSIATETLR